MDQGATGMFPENSEQKSKLTDGGIKHEKLKRGGLTDMSNDWAGPSSEFVCDATNRGEPFQVTEYAADIFRYYHYRELKFRVLDYLPKHPFLKKVCRAKFVDTFVKWQEDFEVEHEVLYHTVKLFDLYLSVTENHLELDYIGASAMIIAAKLDPYIPQIQQQDVPEVDNFKLSRTLMKAYETRILRAFNCDVNFPVSYHFLRRFARVAGLDLATLTLARYILETSLLFYEFICVPDSLMAAAAFMLAVKMIKTGNWTQELEEYSGYKLCTVQSVMWSLNHMMHMRPKVYPMCVRTAEKYRHNTFFHAAEVPLLQDMRRENEPVGPPSWLRNGCNTTMFFDAL